MKWLFLLASFAYGDIESHLKKAEGKSEGHSMPSIDFIYMINLDQRPEKWRASADQLVPFGIHPYRFSAVNGWELTFDVIDAVGVKFAPWMEGGFWATVFRLKEAGESPIPPKKEGYCKCIHPFEGAFIWEQEEIHELGKTYFSHCMERGTIGISLSHISILKDAWDSRYETIWVMEDDIRVLKDPRILSQLIELLDDQAGKDRWDLLFTDQDIHDAFGNTVPAAACAKRPDYKSMNDFVSKTAISAEFRKIGSRYGAHSMIIRRSGIKKLLQFFLAHQIFLPYDMDYTLPNGIQLYTVLEDVVSDSHMITDNGCPNYLMEGTREPGMQE
jgi:GR25 family glycosyltransferase involved in LPS biosynthesis